MNPNTTRAVVLVAIAALLGWLVLRSGADLSVAQQVEGSVSTTGGNTNTEPDADEPFVDSDAVSETGSEPAVVVSATATPDVSTSRPPAEVTVLVANGSGIDGQAGRLTAILKNQGFVTRPAANSNETAVSVIYYKVGYSAEAIKVRDALGATTITEQLPLDPPSFGDGVDLTPVNVFVLIGADSLASG